LTITWCETTSTRRCALFAPQHLDHAAQPEHDVAPALAAGRPEIELADERALRGELGKLLLDAVLREAVEDPELLLAQALVDAHFATGMPIASEIARQVCCERTNGEVNTQSGRSDSGRVANHAPSAAAWRSPSSDSGVSRRASRCRSARAPRPRRRRARRCPALWPWRTSESRRGQSRPLMLRP
jgi:hypothetical protein